MKTNIVALFDNRDEAQAAVRRLLDAGLDRNDISVVASEDGNKMQTSDIDGDGNIAAEGASAGISSGTLVGGAIGLLAGIGLGGVPLLGFLVAGPIAGLLTGAVAGAATGGLVGGLIGLGIPEHEAHEYSESIKRGGTLVTAHVDDALAPRYEAILEGAGGNELSGGTGYGAAMGGTAPAYGTGSTPMAAPVGESTVQREAYVQPVSTPSVNTTTTPMNATAGQTLDVVEEDLTVGKRQVETGGVRVRRYVTERPATAQVTLTEEHATIDRRAVDHPVGSADFTTGEQVIEIRETAEVPVVAKQARVVEEVVIGKTSESHVETIEDTVRRTDVEVEQIPGQTRGPGSGAYADKPL